MHTSENVSGCSTFPRAQADELAAAIDALDELDDVRSLIRLLVVPGMPLRA